MSLITEKIQKAFDNAANSYDRFSYIQDIVLQRVCGIITLKENNRKNILDVGCGTGNISKFLNITNHNFIQIDLSKEMCILAEEKNNRLSVNCSMDMMPFHENFFDVVITSMVLQWSCNINISLLELLRVMKPSGTLYIAIPIFGTLVELSDVIERIGGCFSQFYKMEELINIVNSLNVKIQHAFCCKYHQYHKSFRSFLLSMKLTGVYTKKNVNMRHNIFTISKIYEELYSLQGCIFNSWNIMYLMIKKIIFLL
ncbi:MAG: methyltransferase domain-containing protein [Ehrlichia sp.]